MNERNYGLDIYRIIAMLMITALHVNNQHLNLLWGSYSPNIAFAGYLIEYACFCGVNCFALLTGYLASSKPMDYDIKWFSKIFDIWGKTILFGLIIYFLNFFISSSPVFFRKDLIHLVFIQFDTLWYIGAYIALLMILPFLSGMTVRTSKKGMAIYLIISFLIFTIFSVHNKTPGSFVLNLGYSTIWLIICYTWGQALRKLTDNIFQWKYNTILLWMGAIAGFVIPFILHFYYQNGRYFSYCSPFCVMEAICLLLLCAKIKINHPAAKKTLSFLSTYSLGIYLFQAQPAIWDRFFKTPEPKMELSQILWRFPALLLGIAVAGIIFYFLICKIFSLRIVTWLQNKMFSILEKSVLLLNSIMKKHDFDACNKSPEKHQ